MSDANETREDFDLPEGHEVDDPEDIDGEFSAASYHLGTIAAMVGVRPAAITTVSRWVGALDGNPRMSATFRAACGCVAIVETDFRSVPRVRWHGAVNGCVKHAVKPQARDNGDDNGIPF